MQYLRHRRETPVRGTLVPGIRCIFLFFFSAYDCQSRPHRSDELLAISLDLWPDYDAGEMQATLRAVMASEKSTILLYRTGTGNIAFLYMGIRVD